MFYQKHLFICTNQRQNGKPCCADHGTLSDFHYLKAECKEKIRTQKGMNQKSIYRSRMVLQRGASERGEGVYSEYMTDAERACNNAAESLLSGIESNGRIRVSQSGCLGRCELGPVMVIYPEQTWYSYKTKDDLDEIIEKDLMRGEKVVRLLLDKV